MKLPFIVLTKWDYAVKSSPILRAISYVTAREHDLMIEVYAVFIGI